MSDTPLSARDVGEVHWLLFWPEAPAGNPYWPDATGAAEALMAACIRQLEEWGVTRQQAGGELPVRGVYGVPEQWPHIRALYQRAGFAHTGHTEIVYLARVDDLPRPAAVPVEGLAVRRTAGMNGTRLSAILGEDVIGYIEVEVFEAGERLPRHGGWADVGNLRVTEPYRRRGVASWLLGQAADWLRLADVDRLLDYAWLEGTDPGGLDYAQETGKRIPSDDQVAVELRLAVRVCDVAAIQRLLSNGPAKAGYSRFPGRPRRR